MRVSLPVAAERGRIRAVMALLCAAVALAVFAPPAAHAEFSEALRQPCTGSAIVGEGSSAQKVAQQSVWIPVTFNSYCEQRGGKAPGVKYEPNGSGCGLTAMGAGGATTGCTYAPAEQEKPGSRNATTRFGGSDAPPTPAQKAAMESTGSEHPGVLHVLPVASFAVTVVVHFPEGCELEDPAQLGGNGNTTTGGLKPGEKGTGEVEGQNNDPAGVYTGDKFSEGTLRVHIEAATLEKIWSGAGTTWGEVLERGGVGHMKGTPTSPLEAEEGITECQKVPVRRVVRRDGSGTTYNFKAYLSLLPGALTAGKDIWKESPVVGDNTNWPITQGGGEKTAPPEAPVPPTKEEEVKDKKTGKEIEEETKRFANLCNKTASPNLICRGSENGGGGVAKVVEATDGSIGYLDLATAHQKNFTITPKSKNGGKPDYTYWVPLQTINPKEVEEGKPGVGANYVEPSQNPLLNLSTEEVPGANCTSADYRGYPTTGSDPTLGDWSQAIGTGSLDTKTYPACGLTYDFAWDDASTVYGTSEAEEKKARTVKDYLTAMTSIEGQAEILGVNYGKLPGTIQEIARKGVASIGWRKGVGGGEGPKEGEKPKSGENGGGGGGGVVVTPPSNTFSVAGEKVKGKSIVLSLVLPGPGKMQIKAVAGSLTVANVTANVSGGNGSITLSISKAALNKLAKVKGHKLKVKITITFTPTGGSGATQTKTLTLTQAATKGKGKGKGKSKGKGKGKKK
jgi:ABC-type phosphate transport system substrate-binding protein